MGQRRVSTFAIILSVGVTFIILNVLVTWLVGGETFWGTVLIGACAGLIGYWIADRFTKSKPSDDERGP